MKPISRTTGIVLISAHYAFLLGISGSFITFITTIMTSIAMYFLSKLAMWELGVLWRYSFCGLNRFIGWDCFQVQLISSLWLRTRLLISEFSAWLSFWSSLPLQTSSLSSTSILLVAVLISRKNGNRQKPKKTDGQIRILKKILTHTSTTTWVIVFWTLY